MQGDFNFKEIYLPSAVIGNGFRFWWFKKHTVNIRGKDMYQHHDTVSLTRIPFLRRNIQFKRCTQKRKRCPRQYKIQSSSVTRTSSTIDMFKLISSTKSHVLQVSSLPAFGNHNRSSRYNPKVNGLWNPPSKPLNAFQLFTNEWKQKNPNVDNATIVQQWTCLDTNDLEQWDQKQIYEKIKYRRLSNIYKQARRIGTQGYVLYHYLYLDSHGKVSAQIEKRSDRKCPFCSYDAFHDVGLVLHCKTAHEDNLFHKKTFKMLTFEAGIDEGRNLHVLVKSGKLGNHVSNQVRAESVEEPVGEASTKIIHWEGQISNPCMVQISIPFIRKPPHMTTLLETQTRKKKIRQLEQRIAYDDRCHPLALTQFQVPKNIPLRQYYHAKTMQPMGEGEWNVDSDDEDDGEWFHTLADHLVNEYKDDEVLDEEKLFFIMWNRFVYSNTVVADSKIPTMCANFILKYRDEISRQKLRDQLLLHLMNLWDNQLISWKMIIDLMYVFDHGVPGSLHAATSHDSKDAATIDDSKNDATNDNTKDVITIDDSKDVSTIDDSKDVSTIDDKEDAATNNDTKDTATSNDNYYRIYDIGEANEDVIHSNCERKRTLLFDSKDTATFDGSKDASTSNNSKDAATSNDSKDAATIEENKDSATIDDSKDAATSNDNKDAANGSKLSATSHDSKDAATIDDSKDVITSDESKFAATSRENEHAATIDESKDAPTSHESKDVATNEESKDSVTFVNSPDAATSYDGNDTATSYDSKDAATSNDNSHCIGENEEENVIHSNGERKETLLYDSKDDATIDDSQDAATSNNSQDDATIDDNFNCIDDMEEDNFIHSNCDRKRTLNFESEDAATINDSKVAATIDGSKLSATTNDSTDAATIDDNKDVITIDGSKLSATSHDSKDAATIDDSKDVITFDDNKDFATSHNSKDAATIEHSMDAATSNDCKFAAIMDDSQDNATTDHSKGAATSNDNSHRIDDNEEENAIHSNGDRKRTLLFEETNNNGLEYHIEQNNDNNLSISVGKTSIQLKDGIKRFRPNSSAN